MPKSIAATARAGFSGRPVSYRRHRTASCRYILYIVLLTLGLHCHAANAEDSSVRNTGDALEKVVLQLKWRPQFQFAGFYAAQELGYYADAGFDVEIRPLDPKVPVIDAVLDGDAHFGISDSSLILHRLLGRPVVTLAAIFQHSPLVLLTKKSDNLLGPYELKGKRVMFRRSLDDATITAMFHQLGIGGDQFHHIPHTFDDDALLNGETDAISAYLTNQPYYYAQKGVPVHIISPLNYGIDFYGDMLFAAEDYVRDNPERAKRFMDASLHGWAYALANKEQVIDWLRTKYGASKTIDHLRFEADETEKMIAPQLIELGHLNISRFQRISDIYKREGMAPMDSVLDGIDFAEYLAGAPHSTVWMKFVVAAAVAVTLLALTLAAVNRRLTRLVTQRTQSLARQTAELAEATEKQASLNERLQYEIDVKNRLFSIIAHDLRSPFTTVLGFTELMVKRADRFSKEQFVDFAGEVNNSALRVHDLLENLLAWARFQMEGKQVSPEIISLEELFDSCRGALAENYAQKGVALEANDLSAFTICADPNMAETVLRNLLANAVKFTEAGGSVLVTANKDGEFIRVSVRDSGIGMAPDLAAKLFSIDEKTSRAGTEGEVGTGLGLPLCCEMIESNGGKIWVESREGEGSTFHFTLPSAAAGAENPGSLAAA